jgi:serine/threonine protein kinase
MTLERATRLGPYEILHAIGSGGMGEVYRARDTRLERTVAIKVLPGQVASDPESRARFEREARTIAGLKHPHICTLYDLGHHEGTDFLVMELLEGDTLAARLASGPLPLDEVLRYGVQIADALAGAHRQGIVHRDLKPANIFLARSGAPSGLPVVKLLDFGLAKAAIGFAGAGVPRKPGGSGDLATREQPLTGTGSILGTLQYMAPEQLEGKEADFRTDFFAFGAVLYEMATGKKAFGDGSQASIITAIMSSSPPAISALQALTPPVVDRIVLKCLAKDPEARWQSAQDLRDALKWAAEESWPGPAGPSKGTPKGRERLAWAIGAIATVAAIVLAMLHLRVTPSVQNTSMRFSIPLPMPPDVLGGGSSLSLSPDGTQLVYLGDASGGRPPVLWLRSLDSLEARPLPGTENGVEPFWSPDGRFIAFFAGAKLRKIDASGGHAQAICDAPDGEGGTWNRAGVILFAPSPSSGLYRVSASGGDATAVTVPDQSRQEKYHQHPQFLPDGEHFLYVAGPQGTAYVGSLGSTEPKRLFESDSKILFAPPDWLLFVRGDALRAQRFDAERLQLSGESIPIANGVRASPVSGRATFSISENGILAYRSTTGPSASQLRWFDQSGTPIQSIEPSGPYRNFDLAPDGRRVAVSRFDATTAYDVWILDWTRGTSSRLPFDKSIEADPVWSPDGRRVTFARNRLGHFDIFERAADGLGEETPLLATANDEWPEDWSRDGRFLAYVSAAQGPSDLYVLPLHGDRKPIPVATTPFSEDEPHFSYDGRWIAYNSTESGKPEVFVMPFPPTGRRWQVSTAGGAQPRWRSDGKELYYLGLDGRLMAVDVALGATAESGPPRVLFETGVNVSSALDQYVVTSDGKRFLIAVPVGPSAPEPITIVLDWPATLHR